MAGQPPSPPFGGKGGKRSVMAWIRKHRAEAAGIGVLGALGVVYLYKRSESTADSSGSTSTSSGAADSGASALSPTDPGYGGDLGGGGYGGGYGGDDDSSAYAAQIAALQAQLSQFTASKTPTTKGTSNVFAITAAQAKKLLAGGQRPFVWNGTAYVPATSVTAGQAYYAGPLESREIGAGTGPFKAPPPKTVPKPKVLQKKRPRVTPAKKK